MGKDLYVDGGRGKRGLFCLVLQGDRGEEFSWARTGRGRVFCYGSVFRLPQMGRRRGDFRVFQTGEGYPEGLPSQGGERKGRRAHVESGERTDSVRAGE